MMRYEEGFANWRRNWRALTLAFVCMFGGVWATSAVAQVISNAITITAPATGTTVAPGQSLQVSVSVATGTTFSAIQVIGEGIGITAPKQTSPYSFVLTIPNNIIGPKKITAFGITGPGNGVFSQSVVVDVENPGTPFTDVSVEPPRINFRHVGDHVNLTVIGTSGDGTDSEITRSSKTSYQTNDATVATVGTDGAVTAAGVGTTGILVKYGGQLVPVPVSVTETFAGKPGSPNCYGKSVSALAQKYGQQHGQHEGEHDDGGLAAAAKALGYPSVQALQDAIRAYCGR